MLTDKQRKILDELYYNPKTGYTGIEQLSRRAKLPAQTVKYYMQEQETYTRHKHAVQKFPTRKVITHSADHQYQADLADMRSLPSQNNKYNYTITVLDVVTKYAWAISIK